MNFLKKLWFDITNRKVADKGWRPDTPDPRDYKFAEYFAKDIFGAVIPETFLRTINQLPRISDQKNTLSCVCNSFSFVNAYNSKQEGNDVFLSWRFLYAMVTRLSGGTTFRENGSVLRDVGQPLDLEMPQAEYYLAANQAMERKLITNEMKQKAAKFKIKNYFYISGWRKSEMKTAIMKAPVIIGVYTNGSAWSKNPIPYDGNEQYGHAIAVVGWTKNAWIIADWQGDGTLRYLDINHPIQSAIVLLDMPDNGEQLMLKTVKAEDAPEIWLLLPNGKRQHIKSFTQYNEGIERKMWTPFSLIHRNEIDTYPITDDYQISKII